MNGTEEGTRKRVNDGNGICEGRVLCFGGMAGASPAAVRQLGIRRRRQPGKHAEMVRKFLPIQQVADGAQ